jgi:hypothetical protein
MNSVKSILILLFFWVIVSCQQNSVDPKPSRRFLSESISTANEIWINHSTYTVSYNEDGSLAKSEETQSDTSSVATVNKNGTTVYEYNDKRLVVSAKKLLMTKTTTTSPFSYTTPGTEQWLYWYEYDTNDQLVKSVSQFTDDNRRYRRETRTYVYDASGKLLSCNAHEQYNLIETKADFTFQNGILVKYAESTPNSTTNYEINSTGLLTKIFSGPYAISQRSYDTNGNLIRNEEASSTYTYLYDKAPAPRSTSPKLKGHPDDVVAKLLNPSPNNVVKETVLNNNTGVLVTSEINYNVSYDSDGLLTTKSWVDPKNKAYYRKYTYTYQ